eukprot:s874_g8.t1
MAVPGLLLPTCFINIVFGTWLGWTLLSYYAMFHFAKQPFGLLCLYKARQGERGALLHQLDYWTCMAGAGLPLLLWHAGDFEGFSWFGGEDQKLVELPQFFRKPLWLLYFLVPGLWLGHSCADTLQSLADKVSAEYALDGSLGLSRSVVVSVLMLPQLAHYFLETWPCEKCQQNLGTAQSQWPASRMSALAVAALLFLLIRAVQCLDDKNHRLNFRRFHLPWQFQTGVLQTLKLPLKDVLEHVFRNRQRGSFVELGAADGKFLSNTYALEHGFDWFGILIEPLPEQVEKCRVNRPRSTCVQACVAKEPGLQHFGEDMVRAVQSGLVRLADVPKKGWVQREIHCRTLPDILREHDMPRVIDWLSLDVEGAELEILESVFQDGAFHFDVISLEATTRKDSFKKLQFMHNHGYQFMDRFGDDVYVYTWTSQESNGCEWLRRKLVELVVGDFQVDDKAELLIHPPRTQEDLFLLTESCAGLGALGHGATNAGWKVVAQNDIQPSFANHQAKVMSIPVVTGDIGEELASLTLTEVERRMFEQYGRGIGGQPVDKNKPCPTALHAWGNQCLPCACGCRGPFSCERLAKHGLFGAIVHVAGQTPDKNLRHLSAREVALLNAFAKKEGWSDSPRFLLAGMGQMASPMQSAWIFTHIRNHLVDSQIAEGPKCPPTQILACIAMEVFELRDEWFKGEQTVTMELFREAWDAWMLNHPERDISHAKEATALDELTPSQESRLVAHLTEVEQNQEVMGDSSSLTKVPDLSTKAQQVSSDLENTEVHRHDTRPIESEASEVGPHVSVPDSFHAKPSTLDGPSHPPVHIEGFASEAGRTVLSTLHPQGKHPIELNTSEVGPHVSVPDIFHAKPLNPDGPSLSPVHVQGFASEAGNNVLSSLPPHGPHPAELNTFEVGPHVSVPDIFHAKPLNQDGPSLFPVHSQGFASEVGIDETTILHPHGTRQNGMTTSQAGPHVSVPDIFQAKPLISGPSLSPVFESSASEAGTHVLSQPPLHAMPSKNDGPAQVDQHTAGDAVNEKPGQASEPDGPSPARISAHNAFQAGPHVPAQTRFQAMPSPEGPSHAEEFPKLPTPATSSSWSNTQVHHAKDGGPKGPSAVHDVPALPLFQAMPSQGGPTQPKQGIERQKLDAPDSLTPIDDATSKTKHPAVTPGAHLLQPHQPPRAPADDAVDHTTGSIAAFSSNKKRIRQPEHSPERTTSTETTKAAPSSVQHAQSIATSILQGEVVLFDYDHMVYHTFKHSEAQTVSDLIQATNSLIGTCPVVMDLMGRPLPPDTVLAEHKLLAVGNDPIRVAQSLRQRTADLQLMPRKEALFYQQGAVALDEMHFYMSSLACFPGVQVLSPLVITGIDDANALAEAWLAEAMGTTEKAVSAVWFNSHWIPVIVDYTDPTPAVFTSQVGKDIWSLLFPYMVQEQVHMCVPFPLETLFPDDCGFQVLAWITDLLSQREHSPMPVSKACKWRQLFWRFLLSNEIQHPRPLLLGGQSELETAITAILKEHGVFTSRVVERAKQVINAIGAQPLTQALRSTRPWAAIKELANQHTPKIRLVLEDEFDQVVKHRTNDKQSFSGRKKRQITKPLPPPVLTASDIVIPEGVFCQPDGQVLAQVPLRSVNTTARGVVLSTEQEIQPYLSQRQVSKECLAFVVLVPHSDDLKQHGTSIRFPAQCLATGEPVLLSGLLIQKALMRPVELHRNNRSP